MKKTQITIGETYIAKVSDKLVEVRIDAENRHGGWDATNLATNKKVRIKSAQRLRRPAKGSGKQAKSDPDLVPLSEAMKNPAPRSKRAGTKRKQSNGNGSGLDAAAQVLKAKGEPMRCKDLVEQMLARRLWKTQGKTPAATIYSAILREIQTRGSESRFRKTDRGLFAHNA